MSLSAGTGFSRNTDSFRAGAESAEMALGSVDDPSILILFASVLFDHEMVLKGVRSITKDVPLIGGSAFGEMSNHGMNNRSVVLMAVETDGIELSFGLGNGSDQSPASAGEEAAKEAIEGLGPQGAQLGFFISEMLRSSKTLKGLDKVLGNDVGLLGGCSSGDRTVPVSTPEFTQGFQYVNDQVHQHSVPLMLMSGDFKHSFGVGHGWQPLGKAALVGKSEENIVYEIDKTNATDFYGRYLGKSSFVPYPLGFYQGDHLLLRTVTGTKEDIGLSFT